MVVMEVMIVSQPNWLLGEMIELKIGHDSDYTDCLIVIIKSYNNASELGISPSILGRSK